MNSNSLVLLRSQHRRALWLRPLWIVVFGLLLELGLAALGVSPEGQLVSLGLVFVLAIVAGVWPRRVLHDTARSLDAQVNARNRFEAVAELGARTDPLAGALRDEADRYMMQHPLPRGRAWAAAILSFAVLLPLTLVQLGNGWLNVVQRPALATDIAKEESNGAPSLNAHFKWITPGEEIGALATDVLPLTAAAESSHGMRQVTLHVIRNGEPLQPVELMEEVAAGVQRVSTPLRLSELPLRGFDIISYFLRAEPRGSTGSPVSAPVSSPLQFVQIMSEDDARLAGACSNCSGGIALEIVRRLKREQLGVVRDIATVAHNTPAGLDAAWADAVAAIEARETRIHEETTALLPMLVEARIPNAAIEALFGAKQETFTTATELRRSAPAPAMAPAGRALARFAAAEKELAQNVLASERRTPPEATPTLLPPREQTPAGRLEILAIQQATVAEQIASRDPLAAPLPEQERLAREITKLAGERALPAPVTDRIKDAGEATTEAARQLGAEDPVAATEPATRAAQSLADAAAMMNAAGRSRAADELLGAQRVLIRTATELHQAELVHTAEAAKAAAGRIRTIHAEARAAAERQQQQGSADAARNLLELAQSIDRSDVQKDFANLVAANPSRGDQKTLEEKNATAAKILHLAQRAADVAAELQDPLIAQTRAIEELQRAHANLERAGSRPAGSNPTRDAAEIVALYEDALRNAQRLAGVDSQERGLPPPPGPGNEVPLRDYASTLSRQLDGLLRLALTTPAANQRSQMLTFGNPGAAPPAYRSAVAEYFETLARDATGTGKQ